MPPKSPIEDFITAGFSWDRHEEPGRTLHGFDRKEFAGKVHRLLVLPPENFGTLSKYLYTMPLYESDPVQTATYWEEAASDAGYRMLREEEKTLAAPGVKSFLKKTLPADATLIDIAPGPAYHKTEMTMDAINPSLYVAVDIVKSFAEGTEQKIREIFKERVESGALETLHITHNIYEKLPFKDFPNPVMILYGGLLSNSTWPADENTSDQEKLDQVKGEIAAKLANFRSVFANSGKFVCFWDLYDPSIENYGKLIEDEYNNIDGIRKCITNVWHVIKNDLDTENLDPEPFRLKAVWHEAQRRVALNTESLKEQHPTIEGEKCHIKKASLQCINNALKFTEDDVRDIYARSGFENAKMLQLAGSRVALFIADVPFLSGESTQALTVRHAGSNDSTGREAIPPAPSPQ